MINRVNFFNYCKGKNRSISQCLPASDAKLYICFAYYNKYNEFILGAFENL